MIDTNAYLGAWPFFPHPSRTGPELAEHLGRHGIRRALVSHLAAVFHPEPMWANRELFAAARAAPRLAPVPILNPALATWREQLEECRSAAKLRAVRIVPAYHHYSLRHKNVADFVGALAAAGLRLIVSARLEDERNKYFALDIGAVPNQDLAALLARFPRQQVLITGLYRGDLIELAKDHRNFCADISLAEYWDSVVDLLKVLPAARLMLGTNTPLLYTLAATAKVRHAAVPARVREAVGSGNARRFFSL